MEKLAVMLVAALLTAANLAGGGTPAPPDPRIEGDATKARNLQVWETFRIYYAGCLGASVDDKGWAAPAITSGLLGQLGSLLPLLLKLVPGGAVGTLLGGLAGNPPAPLK